MKSRYDAIRDLTNMLATTLVFSDSVQNVIINGTLYDAVIKLRKSCKLRYDDKEFARFEDDVYALCNHISSNKRYDATHDLSSLVKAYA